MATYWNKTTSGYVNSTYCYGYYQGQYYYNSKYVVSGNYMDWAYYDSGVYLKVGSSSAGYYWQNVTAKRVYTQYKDTTSGYDSGTSHYAYFYWTNSTTTTTIKSYSDVGITAPSGKVFKEWNTAEDGSGDSYAPGDTITDKAGSINYYKLTRTLYAVWENDDGSADESTTEELTHYTRYWSRGNWYDQIAQEVMRITGTTDKISPAEVLELLKSIE